jgi:type II secretory pathway pseudopilin PulG
MPIRLSRNKHSFTLLEIVIVTALIAISLGTLSFQIANAVGKTRCEHAVDQLIGKIILTQKLMLDLHTDVSLHLRQDSGKLFCVIAVNCPLPASLDQAINRYNRIDGVDKIALNGNFTEEIVLSCQLPLGILKPGVITVYSGSKNESILMRGYPALIKEGENATPTVFQTPYPEEIVSFI